MICVPPPSGPDGPDAQQHVGRALCPDPEDFTTGIINEIKQVKSFDVY